MNVKKDLVTKMRNARMKLVLIPVVVKRVSWAMEHIVRQVRTSGFIHSHLFLFKDNILSPYQQILMWSFTYVIYLNSWNICFEDGIDALT